MESKRFWARAQNLKYSLVGFSCLVVMTVVATFLEIRRGRSPDYARFLYLYLGYSGLVGAYLSTRKPLIEISSTTISYRERSQKEPCKVQLSDVERIEWPGYDNIGIRLKGGRVVSISVMQLPKEKREEALKELQNAVAAYAVTSKSAEE